MARRTNTMAPQPKHEPEVAPKAQPQEAQPVSNIAAGKPVLSRTASIRAENQERLSRKAQLRSEASQRMAELADLEGEKGEVNEEVETLAARITGMLYSGMTAGLITREEASADLGAQFGFVPKKDGSPGKTPQGVGKAIRDRLVRNVAAHDFATGGDGGTYFEGVEPDWMASEEFESMTVLDVITRLESDDPEIQINSWYAYKVLQDIKRNNSHTVELAFDAKRIASLAAKLGKSVEASAKLLNADENLLEAWADLIAVFAIVDAKAAELAAAE